MATLFRDKHGPLSRVKALLHSPRFNCVAAGSRVQARVISTKDSESAERIGAINVSKWKKLDSRCVGITSSMIPRYALSVLSVLRRAGFDAYLVGGCVRDLLLKRIPKDFDVITSADLQKVKKQFHPRCAQIVGRRFPICIVRNKGSIVEVSSFKIAEVKNAEVGEKIHLPPCPRSCSVKDFTRWRDSVRRDFTVNSLFLDPFTHTIYDYNNGMEDLKSLTLRTLIPAKSSFKEDSARILRGLRIAARLGLEIAEETENAICSLSSSIKCLRQDRIMLEMNYMLSYGAAEPSFYLLWRFKLLEFLLPLQKLFSNMDKLVSCDQPSHSTVWIGLLAFHHALVCCPQDAQVVHAFASILQFGWKEGIEFARTKANYRVHFVPEISELPPEYEMSELEMRVGDLASLVKKSVIILSNPTILNESMSRYPVHSSPGLVFVSKKAARDVQGIFHVLVEQSYNGGHDSKINKKLPRQIGSLLGQIILETMSDGAHVGMETLELERGEHSKVIMDKQSDGVALIDVAVARAHHRPKKLHGKAMVDLAIEQQVRLGSRDVSRKRTILGMKERQDRGQEIRASWRKENEAWENLTEKPRPPKMQKTISGNRGQQ
ncbi:hypothetical protein SAY86_017382 [Trapa natans]|uniref:Poly(A) polymerase n=1 Tax=Trapa natans TaxID=22666 RepID=A0AAN7LKH9_TRANT|nr:hypothetical protein SAY86_017382 [Trapa natans]